MHEIILVFPLQWNGNYFTNLRLGIYRVFTKSGAVSKINNKFISHLTWAKRTPSAAATVQVSHALPCMVRFF